ncbi:MAG: hypothetical protein ACREXY_01305 [Gammaproteobacteria bacterium]
MVLSSDELRDRLVPLTGEHLSRPDMIVTADLHRLPVCVSFTFPGAWVFEPCAYVLSVVEACYGGANGKAGNC